ncbi:MAG TPA: hypothetical protein VFQ71_11060 [Gaiellales bacterium]|nr:hypothetical protein [Gaiellales bacterium]
MGGVDSGDDPNAGLNLDVGRDLHEWTTRWEQIEVDRPDAPGEALQEAVALLDDMLRDLHVASRGAAAAGSEDVVRTHQELHELVDRLRQEDSSVDQAEISDAFDEAQDMFMFLASGRRPGEEAPPEG